MPRTNGALTPPNLLGFVLFLVAVLASTVPKAVLAVVGGAVAIPNARQLEFMEMETVQFMHYGIPTYWDPPPSYLHGPNPTYHDCTSTTVDHSNQTHDYYPCLNPEVFQPTDLDTDDWMRHSASMGMKEICLTAHHEGGFCLWPTRFSNYSVAASSWRGGKGDVLREFADSANRWGIKICYYLNVQSDGYLTKVAKVDGKDFIRRQVGMIHEVLTKYGPVNRFWFDGTKSSPPDTNTTELWERVYREIRQTSPQTLISPYRGDVCASTGSLYTSNGGAEPNSTTDLSRCGGHVENGTLFHPTEMHGITMQEGPDGNTNDLPTYWFWHPWACAGNITGCPWVGHGNASRVFDSYLTTVGHGAVLNMNIPPDRRGRMNESVAEVMRDVGLAINRTFGKAVRGGLAVVEDVGGRCVDGLAVIDGLSGQHDFDYVVSMEDLKRGQRIANYSVEYREVGSDPDAWKVLVPVLDDYSNRSSSDPTSRRRTIAVGDRPDGHDPRDQYVGHKRIDFPVVDTRSVRVDAVRFNCHRSLEENVYLRRFSLHKKDVPWEHHAAKDSPISIER